MTSPTFEATRLFSLGVDIDLSTPREEAFAEGSSWAHVSGWAQLSGAPRRISCVVWGRAAEADPNALLPRLSDALTEIGHPWEVLLVDSDPSLAPAERLGRWAEIPGFRSLRSAAGAGDEAAAWLGLREARGDAVVLLGDPGDAVIDRLAGLIDDWEAGCGPVPPVPIVGGDAPDLSLWLLDRESVDAVLNSPRRTLLGALRRT